MVHFKDRLFLDNHDRAQHVKKKKSKNVKSGSEVRLI